MQRSIRYHIDMKVRGQNKRTTVSLDNMLSELLEIKLGGTPGTNEAHAMAREWLQEQYDKLAKSGKEESRWFRREVILLIADKSLRTKWMEI